MIFGPKKMVQGPWTAYVRVKMFGNGIYQSLMSITALLSLFGSVRAVFFTISMENGLFWPFFALEYGTKAV